MAPYQGSIHRFDRFATGSGAVGQGGIARAYGSGGGVAVFTNGATLWSEKNPALVPLGVPRLSLELTATSRVLAASGGRGSARRSIRILSAGGQRLPACHGGRPHAQRPQRGVSQTADEKPLPCACTNLPVI